MYFWRDSTGHEIDLLIECDGGKLLPIEAKSGATFNSDFVRDLAWWRGISGSMATNGLILYGGEKSFPYKDDLALAWRAWG